MRRPLHHLFTLTLLLFACWGLQRAVDLQVAQAGGLSGVATKGPTLPERVDGTRAATESLYQPKWPTAAAMRWQPPKGFLRQSFCIHRHESVDWYRAYVDWRGQPSVYSGGMQFTLSTWQRAGGTGHPHQWRPREQVYRAFVIWRANGGSWVEWGTRRKCGL